MTTDILKEFGERYGEKVVGYWFDGFYQCFEKYPDFSFRDFFKVCKAGNSESDHRCELMDLSQRHRMAGLLGGRDGQPRRVAGQRHQRSAAPDRGCDIRHC